MVLLDVEDLVIDFDKYRVGRDGHNTLPKARYTSREFLELEFRKLWPLVWHVVCREDELPNVGDYVEHGIGDYTVLVIRSAPDTIKALSNSCLHRGRQLREGSGNAKEIRCAYHGWRYNLDGSIKSVVDPHEFDRELVELPCLHLPEFPTDTWAGFVFINLDPHAEPLSEFLAPLPELFDRWGWNALTTIQHRRTILQCNWKAALDAFQDGWHNKSTHSQFDLQLSDEYILNHEFPTFPKGHTYMKAPGPLLVGQSLMESRSEFRDSTLDIPEAVRSLLRSVLDVEAPVIDAMVDGIKENIPKDVESLASFWAGLSRGQAGMRGLDLSAFSDEDLLSQNFVTCFPNLWLSSAGPDNSLFFSFRPNGSDPHTCIYDDWTCRLVSEAERTERAKTRVKTEFYPHFEDYDGWVLLVKQDMGNTKRIQAGLRDPTSKFVRLGRLDGMVAHTHAVIDDYLTR